MKERPILFSAPMVQAILDGRKTQTRRDCGFIDPDFERATRAEPAGDIPGYFLWKDTGLEFDLCARCPYGVVGDRLWVKENYRLDVAYDDNKPREVEPSAAVWYEARGFVGDGVPGKLRPSIFMRRCWSRLTLEIEEVRVERLQEISEEDAKAEGVLEERRGGHTVYGRRTETGGVFYTTASAAYMDLWCEINGRASWNGNPWVWIVTFAVKRITL